MFASDFIHQNIKYSNVRCEKRIGQRRLKFYSPTEHYSSAELDLGENGPGYPASARSWNRVFNSVTRFEPLLLAVAYVHLLTHTPSMVWLKRDRLGERDRRKARDSLCKHALTSFIVLGIRRRRGGGEVGDENTSLLINQEALKRTNYRCKLVMIAQVSKRANSFETRTRADAMPPMQPLKPAIQHGANQSHLSNQEWLTLLDSSMICPNCHLNLENSSARPGVSGLSKGGHAYQFS